MRRPLEEEPNAYTYDYDLPQHTVVIWHWFEMSARETFTLGRFLNERVNGTGMIINGKGRIKIFQRDDYHYVTPVEVFQVLEVEKYSNSFVVYSNWISIYVLLFHLIFSKFI